MLANRLYFFLTHVKTINDSKTNALIAMYPSLLSESALCYHMDFDMLKGPLFFTALYAMLIRYKAHLSSLSSE